MNATPDVLTATPTSLSLITRLTARQPISHHDASGGDGSNMLLFNRQKQVVPRTVIDQPGGETFPISVPEQIQEVFTDLTHSELVATAIARLFIDEYNSVDGTGLFTGMDRYVRLESRLRQSAARSHNLRGFWNRFVLDMHVPIHKGATDAVLAKFFGLPASVQAGALQAIVRDYRSITALARLCSSEGKKKGTTEVEVAGRDAEIPAEVAVIDVPTMSGNGLRHQMVRSPLWSHLCERIGINEAFPGQGAVPPGVEALFVNGGNIAAGSKQIAAAHTAGELVRRTFPSLDLLGGVCDSFDLGESRLSVVPYLVCKENRRQLMGIVDDSPMLDVSAYDLIDDVTLTRMETSQGVGQMIYNFETLAVGTEIVVVFGLHSQTPRLTRGALMTAIERFGGSPHIGGQKRAGYGLVNIEIEAFDDADSCRDEYENYITENAESLFGAVSTGTLGTGLLVAS